MSVVLLGSIAASGGTGGAYHAGAVQFDGATTYLTNDSLVSTDNKKWSWGGWFNISADNPTPVFWVIDPEDTYSCFMNPTVNMSGVTDTKSRWSAGASNANVSGFSAEPWATAVWTFLLVSVDVTDANPDNWNYAYYVNDVSVGSIIPAGTTFNIPSNGLPFWLGNDGFGANDFYKGGMADVRFMPGMSLLTGNSIDEATRRLFITSGGKPVNPAVATASLGTPAILFSGDATSFATNQGSGGIFTTTGMLTNASTSPSD
jgi:hypothetical protein